MFKSQSQEVRRSQGKFKIKNLVFLFLTCVLCLVTCDLFAQPISSTELINNAKQYDGETVGYSGEVIGDIMVRGEYAWVNVNDGEAAIGIWLNKDLTKDILYTGCYKAKGDRVEIVGVFHRACLQHGGDLDIHAQSIKKISPGRNTSEKLNLDKRNLAFVLFGVLFIVWILRQLKNR